MKKLDLSPNFSKKARKKKDIKFVIIHYTGMQSEIESLKRLKNTYSKVSCHYFINKKGEIIQMVRENAVAWHAGKSKWGGFKNLNEFSIGIELEGTDENTYTEDQYRALIDVTKELMFVFRDLKKENIVGHSDIAPGRKTDPGEAFDWHYYLSNLE